MTAQELKDKIQQMRSALSNPNISGPAKTALEAAIANANMQLGELEAKPARSTAGFSVVKKSNKMKWDDYPFAKLFMPIHQQRVVAQYDEERDEIVSDVNTSLAKIPTKRQSEKDPTVFAHYFHAQSDWFILEYDKEEDLFFGFTILNGDSQMAELGYISREELVNSGRIELDFYWSVKTLAQAKYEADSDMWPNPKAIQEPAPQPAPQPKPEPTPEMVAPAPTPVVTPNPTDCAVTRNMKKNGIEIRFEKEPSIAAKKEIENKGFRYSRFNKLWYVKYSEALHQWTLAFCGNEKNEAEIVVPTKNERLITLATTTKNGKVPKNLLISEIEAGKLEVSSSEQFNHDGDYYDIIPDDERVWETATMDSEVFEIQDLNKGHVNNHWTNSITLRENGVISLGKVEFRYKKSVKNHDYTPQEENQKIQESRNQELAIAKETAAKVTDLEPSRWYVPMNRPAVKGKFNIESPLKPAEWIGKGEQSVVAEIDGYPLVGTAEAKSVVTGRLISFGGASEELRENLFEFTPEAGTSRPTYLGSFDAFGLKQEGDKSAFPGWKVSYFPTSIWDSLIRATKNAISENQKMATAKNERGAKIHKNKLIGFLDTIKFVKKVVLDYEAQHPNLFRQVTGQDEQEYAQMLGYWAKELGYAQPKAERVGETVADDKEILTVHWNKENKVSDIQEYIELYRERGYDKVFTEVVKTVILDNDKWQEVADNLLSDDYVDLWTDSQGKIIGGHYASDPIYYSVKVLNKDTNLFFLVNTEGYTYARYVYVAPGTIDEIEKTLPAQDKVSAPAPTQTKDTDELETLVKVVEPMPQPTIDEAVNTTYFSYIIKDKKIALKTEYNPEVVVEAKKLNGTWDSYKKTWGFDLRDLDRVKIMLKKIFGTDGIESFDLVDVLVYMDNLPSKAYLSNYGHSVFALGRQLAHRKYRDKSVQLGQNVTVLEGGFPAMAGSVKNPRLNEESGTVLMVRDVPRSIVEKDELNCEDCYQIVGEEKPSNTPAPTQTKDTEKEALVKVFEEQAETVASKKNVNASPKYRVGDQLVITNKNWGKLIYKIIEVLPSEYVYQKNSDNTEGTFTEEDIDRMLAEGYELQTKALLGRKRAITLPNGEKHDARFAIMELADILASHNEETFGDTPGYPRNAQGNNLNDRNYATDKAAQQLVEEYARSLNPDLLIALTSTPEGTPIVTPEGFVVSGNNRTMSLKLARKKYPEKYRAYYKELASNLDLFGFEFSSINPFPIPVLVRIDYDFGELTTTNMAKYNASSMKAKSPVDKAAELATTLREQILCETNIPQILGEFDTLSDFYADRAAIRRMITAMQQCSVLNEQDLPAYVDNGLFTEEGKTLLETVLGALVLESDTLRIANRDGVRSFRQAVVNALPVLIQNKNLPPSASLVRYINAAIRYQGEVVASGLSWENFVNQGNIFSESKAECNTVYINRLMSEGQRVFRDAIRKYTESQAQAESNALFAAEVVTPAEAFKGYIIDRLPKEVINRIEKYCGNTPAPVAAPQAAATTTAPLSKEVLQSRLEIITKMLAKSPTDTLKTRKEIVTKMLARLK